VLLAVIFVHFFPNLTTEFDEQFVKNIKEVIKIISFISDMYN